ncbi:hypothetical protein HP572_07545 [Pectobacterium sp. PL64]|uniref:hypothetical protein n=1 Tax=Pectobacterium sp. PL64 TaxID=2738983 RepID=UPI001F0C78C1|nr:hypothetical protein [Pectobacterium sp. PL64]UMO89365.1 hypothetical protein HP572_07545 [Pectobacterium sp. PL64]
MSNERKFDNKRVMDIKDAIYERYPEAKLQSNSIYNKITENKDESLFICLCSLFFGLYARDRINLNKNTQYNNHVLDSNLLTDIELDILKNASGDSLRLVRNELVRRMLNIILEFSFWDRYDYILHFANSEKETIDYIYDNFLLESGLDYLNYKSSLSFKSINFFLEKGKVERAHDLVVKNEKIINELASQTARIKSLKRDVDKLEKSLGGVESTLQVNLLKESFIRIKDSISSQLIDANKKYSRLMILTIFSPLLFLVLSFLVHVFVPFLMNLINYNKVDDYISSVSFGLESVIFYTLPVLAFEMVLLYFSRVMYVDLKSLKAQMIQIEHRIASCEFIRSYVKQKDGYLNEIIKLSTNNDTVKKILSEGSVDRFIGFPADFEKLIFNPIQMNSENIPALLDGVNSIADLAGKVMSAKK